MKGAKLKPIGDCESYPFSGTFDGNGYTVSNFTIDCRGAEYGGFFGCTKNANVANLALDIKGKRRREYRRYGRQYCRRQL